MTRDEVDALALLTALSAVWLPSPVPPASTYGSFDEAVRVETEVLKLRLAIEADELVNRWLDAFLRFPG